MTKEKQGLRKCGKPREHMPSVTLKASGVFGDSRVGI